MRRARACSLLGPVRAVSPHHHTTALGTWDRALDTSQHCAGAGGGGGAGRGAWARTRAGSRDARRALPPAPPRPAARTPPARPAPRAPRHAKSRKLLLYNYYRFISKAGRRVDERNPRRFGYCFADGISMNWGGNRELFSLIGTYLLKIYETLKNIIGM